MVAMGDLYERVEVGDVQISAGRWHRPSLPD
jgi:hypothetical protein